MTPVQLQVVELSSLDLGCEWMTVEGRKLTLNHTSINPTLAKLSDLNFHPFEDACRYRDPQLQVGKNCAYL